MRKPTRALAALLLIGAVSVNADVVRTRGGATGAAGAVTPGTTTVTGCQNLVLYGDNSSLLNCEAGFGYTASTNTFLVPSLTNSALTVTRVPFAGTAGVLQDDADMTFATDTLSVTKITIPNGSAAATSINFGTAGTGIYSSAGASNIDFSGASTNLFRVGNSAVSVLGTTKLVLSEQALTAATMTVEGNNGTARGVTNSFTWSNAQVAALGAVTVGDITVATLPAKTQVLDAMVVITGAAVGPTTVTVSCGDAIAGTPFINYVVASDAKAAANTVYGDAVAERGTSIDVEFYYLPSYTATTLVTCHFISTGANLSTVTGSTGRVILTTRLIP